MVMNVGVRAPAVLRKAQARDSSKQQAEDRQFHVGNFSGWSVHDSGRVLARNARSLNEVLMDSRAEPRTGEPTNSLRIQATTSSDYRLEGYTWCKGINAGQS